MDTLAVKYRPKVFEDVVEQDVIKASLQNQIKNGSIKNCYLFCGGAGTGKAQPLYSKVFTPNGFTEIGKLNIGDTVFDGLGNVTKVLELFDQGLRDVYEITLEDKTTFRVADNHLNSVVIRNLINDTSKYDVLDTKELIDIFNKDTVSVSIPLCTVHFTDNGVDIEKDDIRNQGYLFAKGKLESNSVDNFLFNLVYIRYNFLLGILTAIGRKHEEDRCAIAETSNKYVSDAISFLVRSLGGVDYVTDSDDTYLHVIKISMFLSFGEDIKYIIEPNHINSRKIINIEYTGKEECRCIYVESQDHTYITDNFTVTHNTTNARLFAKEINGGSSQNIIELDAASHNSVEDIRKIIEESKYKPIGTKYRVFILDEVHSLSNASFQVLLKVFEEPTPTSIFILATTDPQKIPATILSRVQRYNFQKITHNGIVNRLKYIIDSENKEGCNYSFDEDAISYIAKLADGGMRDSITLLEKVLSYSSEVNMNSVTNALGTVDYDILFDITDSICKMDKSKTIEIVESVHRKGFDLKQFIKNYCDFVLDLCKYDILRDFEYIQIPNTYSNRISKYSQEDFSFFISLLNEMINLNSAIKWETMPKPIIESTLILLCSEV